MKQAAINYIIRLLIQRGLGVILFLVGSGFSIGLREEIYFGWYVGAALVSAIILYITNPETLGERGKVNTNSPIWDKALLTLFWLLSYFVIYIIAGINYKENQSLNLLFWIGMVFQISASALSLWATLENTFLESTARIQSDRNQVVCQSGPYGIIRHPAYTSILLWCIGTPMILQGWGARVICIMVSVIIIIRTILEDQMLQRELNGYKAYTEHVTYRLIPFIW